MKKIILARDFFLSAVALAIGGTVLAMLPWTVTLPPVQGLIYFFAAVAAAGTILVGLALPVLSVPIYKKGY